VARPGATRDQLEAPGEPRAATGLEDGARGRERQREKRGCGENGGSSVGPHRSEDSGGAGRHRIGDTWPVLDLHHLRLELTRACADAGLDARSVVVFVVDTSWPAGTTPVAYLHPAGFVWPDTVAVFRAVGSERAELAVRRGPAHRLAIWRELPGLPAAALGPMLRHELAHARRWERSGTRFFEADDLLRAAVRGSGGEGYGSLPSELEANAASASYAAGSLTPVELAELRACGECAGLLDSTPPPDDVVEATLDELCRRSDWAPWTELSRREAYVSGVRAACAAWDERAARALIASRGSPGPGLLPVTAPQASGAGPGG
jgi:hypothetical protein